ncbi:MAG TPA: response regulator [Actinomycetota bacterium]|nr:response regulator [Actinomycetota bacterium]
MSTYQDKILIIDDDLDVGEALAVALEPLGIEILTATGGDEGVALATVHKPSVILLDLVMPDVDGVEVCRRLARDVALKHIPVVAVTAHTERVPEVVDCIDDYIAKPFEPTELEVRIKLSLRRSRVVGGANPLTRLPGNVAIQDELMERIRSGSTFALLHIDLDGFKGFNDHYGFMRGDEAIKLLARCSRDAVGALDPQSGFLGHVGGDDLAAVVDPGVAMEVAERIVERWEDLVPNLYEPEDAKRGYIEVTDRRGDPQRYPLVSVSIGVASNAVKPIRSHWEASELAAEMKTVAKSRDGSAVAVDRRREISVQEDTAVPVG